MIMNAFNALMVLIVFKIQQINHVYVINIILKTLLLINKNVYNVIIDVKIAKYQVFCVLAVKKVRKFFIYLF